MGYFEMGWEVLSENREVKLKSYEMNMVIRPYHVLTGWPQRQDYWNGNRFLKYIGLIGL